MDEKLNKINNNKSIIFKSRKPMIFVLITTKIDTPSKIKKDL